MLTIARQGSIADVIAAARDVPARVIPYAAAGALSRTAKLAQTAVIDAMPRVFSNPTRYTLNSTRVVTATKDNLVARVQVKDQAAGTTPENYLAPEVFGGGRNEKRLEKALRYMGVLKAGQWLMPGAAAELDAAGNLSGAKSKALLKTLQSLRGVGGQRADGSRRKGRKLKNDLFVGTPRGGGRTRAGIWRREGHRLRPLFIFATQAPQYRQRLDFDGIVLPVVLERFRDEFNTVAQGILARRR
jgi:hypothetical protein